MFLICKERLIIFSLQELDLTANCLTYVSPNIQYLYNLTSINLSVWSHKLELLTPQLNRISKFPLALSKIKTLTSLNMSNNRLEDLPNELGEFTRLLHLDLSSNRLPKIPFSLGCCFDLITLDLSDNLYGKLRFF